MNGVDKADQLVAHCRPNLRCRRVWLPMFFHCLDIVRINTCIAAMALGWKTTRGANTSHACHKECVGAFSQALIDKAKVCETRLTRTRVLGARLAERSPPSKRARTSTKNPTLPHCRLLGDPGDHARGDAPAQKQCRMCSCLFHKARKEGVTPLPAMRRPKRWCLACKDNLCNEHFDPHHRRNQPSGSII